MAKIHRTLHCNHTIAGRYIFNQHQLSFFGDIFLYNYLCHDWEIRVNTK